LRSHTPPVKSSELDADTRDDGSHDLRTVETLLEEIQDYRRALVEERECSAVMAERIGILERSSEEYAPQKAVYKHSTSQPTANDIMRRLDRLLVEFARRNEEMRVFQPIL
jgi:hypothetical protein